jgi:hypothetical protein
VLSRTEVDGAGTNYDNERVSESRRDLRQAPELRRMVKYRQGIAIIDTADPILFRFLPRADTGDVAVPPERDVTDPHSLAKAVAAMKKIKEAATTKLKSETSTSEKANGGDRPDTDERPKDTPRTTRKPLHISRIADQELSFNKDEEDE